MADEHPELWIAPTGTPVDGSGWISVGTCDANPFTVLATAEDEDTARRIRPFLTGGSVSVTIPIEPGPGYDMLRDLIEQAERAIEALRVPYIRSAHVHDGQVLVLGPAATGHDRNVLILPTGDAGDRMLAELEAAGRRPVEWRQTEDEWTRAAAAAFDRIQETAAHRGLFGMANPIVDPAADLHAAIRITGA